MVAAGFYVIGDNNEPDLVECFICGKQLDGWEAQDDPWLVVCDKIIYLFLLLLFFVISILKFYRNLQE